jgi:hypothetical protein
MSRIFQIALFFVLMVPLANQAESKCPLLEEMRASVQMTREAIQARHNGHSKEMLENYIPAVGSRLPWTAILM